jgi:hypothetical protein
VNFTKTFSLLTVFAFVGQHKSNAQDLSNFEFKMGSVNNYRQSPTGTVYEGGTFDVNLRDGLLTIIPGCVLPFYFNPIPGCAPGATGFITAGDVDGDGLEDAGSYVSVTSISPATIVRPFRPSEVLLASAPPSTLPRPLAGFTNDSRSVFFNIRTESIRQFDITLYDFTREYTSAERGKYDKDIVPGSYIYKFPSLASTTIPVNLAINRFATIDGYRKLNNINVGFRFLNVTFDDGFAVLNPFQINTIKWEGNSTSYIQPASDIMYFSIKALQDPTDPLSDPDLTVPPIFPNFSGTPGTPRVLLPSALESQYILAPNFLIPGQTGLIDVEFFILRRTNTVSFDRSVARFRMPVRVLNPFIIPPPPNVNQVTLNDAQSDFDNDGVSNFSEWIFGSDRANSNSLPVFPSLSFKPPTTAPQSSGAQTFAGETSSGAWEFKVNKIRNPQPKLKYEIQHSADMVNWTTVTTSDPNWILTDDDVAAEIKVTSRTPEVVGGGFFRAKVTPQ